MTKVILKSGVSLMGECLFRECSSLQSFELESNTNFELGDKGELYVKGKTDLIQYPLGKETETDKFTIPTTVKKIRSYSVESSTFTEISIPSGIETIGEFAFRYCNNLVSFTAFTGTTYKSVNGVLFKGTELIHYPAKKTTKKYYIPVDTTKIHSYSFL